MAFLVPVLKRFLIKKECIVSKKERKPHLMVFRGCLDSSPEFVVSVHGQKGALHFILTNTVEPYYGEDISL